MQAALIALAALSAGWLALAPGARLSTPADAQVMEELLPDQPVPPNYVTQSMFLICNSDWLLSQPEADLRSVHAHFVAFGRTIGPDNAAVWFWKRPHGVEDDVVDDLDLERSAEICTRLGLRRSEGPHIVVTSKWDRDHLILALGGLSASRIPRVLVPLSDGLMAGGIDVEDVRTEIWWQTWYTTVEQALPPLGQLASAVKLTIDAKFLKVEVDGSELVD